MLAADSGSVSVTATVVSSNNCKFSAPASTTLAFGNIDPSGSAPASASGSLSFKCGGKDNPVTFALTHDSGLWDTGPDTNRMKHATLAEYLPYTFTMTPSSGSVAKGAPQTVAIGGSISAANYSDASVGSYADTVVVTLNP